MDSGVVGIWMAFKTTRLGKVTYEVGSREEKRSDGWVLRSPSVGLLPGPRGWKQCHPNGMSVRVQSRDSTTQKLEHSSIWIILGAGVLREEEL